MKRREFLAAAAATSIGWLPDTAPARSRVAASTSAGAPRSHDYDNLLILVELKGGNDGLNTVVPFADPLYYGYRPRIAVRRDAAIALDERTALHPSLAPLLPLWRERQLAIVQGVGYAPPNLSHFRSNEIWDTASRADQYLHDGWLTRAFARRPVPAQFAADGVMLGSPEHGPFADGTRTIALANPALPVEAIERNPSLAQRSGIDPDIVPVTDRMASHVDRSPLKTAFPPDPFGTSIKTAMAWLAAQRAAAIRVTLNGFDTHQNQPDRHAALLAQFAGGMIALHDALVELGLWDRTLIVTVAEFGRSARENANLGTDHGTAAPHFVAGGRVRGGLYGDAPQLARIDGNGNLPVGVDFRQVYATVLGPWWGIDPRAVLQQRFEPLPLLRV